MASSYLQEIQKAGYELLKEKLLEYYNLQKPMEFPESLLLRIVHLCSGPLCSSPPLLVHLQSLFEQIQKGSSSLQHLPALINLPYANDYSDAIKQPLKKLIHYVSPAELMEELLQNATASVQGIH